MIKIILTGGGTGGHLFPLVTVAKKLSEIENEEIKFLFVGPKGQMEEQIMSDNDIKQRFIQCGKLRRYFSWLYFVDFFKFIFGFFQSLYVLLKFMPDVVFSKGGYASVPVVMAAKIYCIPVLLHESDAMPGVANRFLGSFSNRIAINFERAKMYFPLSKTFTAGIPVKEDISRGDKLAGLKFLKIKNESKPVVLFLGGSQGAKRMNDEVANSINELVKKFQVIHQIGEKNFLKVSSQIEKRGYKIGYSDYYPVSFIKDELKDVLALADVVVSRAGATSIAELAANKKPIILIPIEESANNHQRINANELFQSKAAIILEEKNFSQNILIYYLNEIINNKELKRELSENIYQFYFPNAAEKISQEILSLAK